MSHSIVFTGKIREGATLQETRRNLAEMFKIADPAVLDRVFSGKPVLLKKGLDEHEARKQEMILLMAGAVCEVRAAPQPPAPPSPPPPVAADGGVDAAPSAAEPPPGIRPARLELSGHAYNPAAAPPPALVLAAAPALSMMPAAPAAAAAAAAPAARESTDFAPAALRGGLAMAPDAEIQAAQAAYEPVRVTNQGRPGEALLDELHAPWDPAFVPNAVRGLSWAGFFAPLLWGSFNGLPLSFLPLLGVRLLRHFVPAWGWMVFYFCFGTFYLIKGRELAWEHKQWRNAEHFNKVQRYWTFGSLAFFALSMYGMLHLMSVERQQARQVEVAEALMRAEAAVMQARTPEAREAAVAERGKVREAFLAAIPDAAQRERERQGFAEVDQEEAERNAPAEPPGETAEAPAPQ